MFSTDGWLSKMMRLQLLLTTSEALCSSSTLLCFLLFRWKNGKAKTKRKIWGKTSDSINQSDKSNHTDIVLYVMSSPTPFVAMMCIK